MEIIVAFWIKQLYKNKTTMIRLLIFMMVVGIIFPLSAQSRYSNIPDHLLKKANAAKDAVYLSQDEKDVILYMNLARIDGKWFFKNVMEQNRDFIDYEQKQYVNSLISDLKKTKNLSPLYPSKSLTKAARFHAKDMGETGKTGHHSSKGTDTFKRIGRYNNGNYQGENCQYGYREPVLIVLDLLVDAGIPSVGHRKNILNPDFKFTGVAIEPHKEYDVNCVMDFSDLE